MIDRNEFMIMIQMCSFLLAECVHGKKHLEVQIGVEVGDWGL